MIIIRDVVYKFLDITSCELVNNSRIIYSSTVSQAKTSIGNMLGRATVGGILLGGVDAIIGGVTANNQTATSEQSRKTEDDYNHLLTVNKISNPNLLISVGENESLAGNLIALFSVIID